MTSIPVPAPTTDADVRADIRAAAVRLIVGGGVASASIPQMCEGAGVGESEFHLHYDTANEVFADIASVMLAAYGAQVGTTMMRRRSLFESMRIAQVAFLDVVERNYDMQHALTLIRVAAINDPALGVRPNSETTLYEEFITNCELWLLEVGRVHDVRWELPTRLLATLAAGSMTAMVLEYLAHRDMQSCRDMIDVIAFDLARRGRRQEKNMTF